MDRFRRAFPLLGHLRDYQKADLRADAIAGLTTAVLLVPQGMAYALLAGLPPVYGIYAALVPPIVYAFLGTSRRLSVGPVALDSLLVFSSVSALAQVGSEAYLAATMTLALLVGLMQTLMGLVRLGFVVNFLSLPVISGWTSAAAVIIALSQIEHVLGVNVENSAQVTAIVAALLGSLPDAQIEPILVTVGALAVIFSLKRWAKRAPAALLALGLSALFVALLPLNSTVAVVGRVPEGLPSLSLSRFDVNLIFRLLPVALPLSLIGFVESISVAKSHLEPPKERLQPDRELIALGLSNTMGSLFGAYPVAGGFSRTSVNASAGARTQVSGLFASGFVVITLLWLTPLFSFIPTAALSAIIITAVFGLVDVKQARRLFSIDRAEFLLLLITFVSTLAFGLMPGIGLGVAASVLWFVLQSVRPHIAVLGRVPGTRLFLNVKRNDRLVTYQGVIALRMDARFFFGNVEFLRQTLEDLEAKAGEPLTAVVLDFSPVVGLDSSAEGALGHILEEYRDRGIRLLLSGVRGPVRDTLESSGLGKLLGADAQFSSVHDAMVSLHPPVRERSGETTSTPQGGKGASASSARL